MKRSLVLFPLLLGLFMVGCGPSMIDVKGKVTYGEKTVKFGDVVIFGSDGMSKSAKIDRNGNYEIKSIAGGKVKIAVISIDPKDVPSGDREKKGPDPVDVENWFPIDKSYSDPNASGLTAALSQKKSEYDIKMTPK